jgi:hypothetical protein
VVCRRVRRPACLCLPRSSYRCSRARRQRNPPGSRIGPTGQSSLLHRIPCVTVRVSCGRSIKEASSSSIILPGLLSTLSLSFFFCFANFSHWQMMYAGPGRGGRTMFCKEANQSNPNQWRTALGRVKQAIEWCHDCWCCRGDRLRLRRDFTVAAGARTS